MAGLDPAIHDITGESRPAIQRYERTRQIEAKAPRKLKHPIRSRKLRSFLDN